MFRLFVLLLHAVILFQNPQISRADDSSDDSSRPPVHIIPVFTGGKKLYKCGVWRNPLYENYDTCCLWQSFPHCYEKQCCDFLKRRGAAAGAGLGGGRAAGGAKSEVGKGGGSGKIHGKIHLRLLIHHFLIQ